MIDGHIGDLNAPASVAKGLGPRIVAYSGRAESLRGKGCRGQEAHADKQCDIVVTEPVAAQADQEGAEAKPERIHAVKPAVDRAESFLAEASRSEIGEKIEFGPKKKADEEAFKRNKWILFAVVMAILVASLVFCYRMTR